MHNFLYHIRNKEKTKKNMNIVTHSGSFHSDEIFAIALIKMYVDVDASILRTRDINKLEEVVASSDTWVIDVGGVYDPQSLNFDHHQATFTKTWIDGTPKSSIGIVWDYLIEKHYLTLPKKVIKKVEFNLIKRIDAHDNGVRSWGLACVFGMYNRLENNDRQFLKAVSTAQDVIENSIYLSQTRALEEEKFSSILKDYDGSNMIVLDEYISSASKSITYRTEALVYVMPCANIGSDTWTAHAVSEKNSIFSSKCKTPEEWNGLTGDELVNVSGISDALFSHKKGFMCVAQSRESAIKMAKIMLKNKK